MSIKVHTDTMSGPFGTNGGDFWSFRPINSINQIVILSGGSEYNNPVGITFSSTKDDDSKDTITIGGGGKDTIVTRTDTVTIGVTEYLEISGTFGTFIDQSYDVLRSIKFVTNVRVYGPYGPNVGSPFSSKAPNGNKIVGFLGRGGTYIDVIGTYYTPM